MKTTKVVTNAVLCTPPQHPVYPPYDLVIRSSRWRAFQARWYKHLQEGITFSPGLLILKKSIACAFIDPECKCCINPTIKLQTLLRQRVMTISTWMMLREALRSSTCNSTKSPCKRLPVQLKHSLVSLLVRLQTVIKLTFGFILK